MNPRGKAAGLHRVRSISCVASATLFAIVLAMLGSPTPARAIKAAEQPQDVRVTADGFSYRAGDDGRRREYRFGDLSYVRAEKEFVCYAQEKDKWEPQIDKSLSLDGARSTILSSLKLAVDVGNDKSCLPLFWRGRFKDEEARFADALNRMIWENSAEVKAQREREIEEKAAAWRAAGSKVEVPEEAQRHFAIAQQAFAEKNFQHQAEELAAALEVYPTWPDEQSDLAVLLGELNHYSEAIQHMQMYLALAPDAPDAQRAKQQIWIWQDKLQSAQQSAPPAPAEKSPAKAKAAKPPR